jgi:hypothetical protein
VPLDRPPLHTRRLVALPGLDYRALGPIDVHTGAAREHMVVQVAVAGQPDPSVEHGQLAGAVADESRSAGGQAHRGGRGKLRSGLRIHHQSPCEHETIFVDGIAVVQ